MIFEKYGVHEIHEIASPDQRYSAVLAPQGAALKSLIFNGADIVVTPKPVTDFTFAGSTLAPWPNRLEDANWAFFEQSLTGEITEVANQNGLHGLLVKRDFTLVEQMPNSVAYSYLFGADAVYPFTVQLFVKYTLTNEGLKVTITAQNQGGEAYPMGVGSHPYFALDADSTLETTAHSSKVNNERQLPVGETSVEEIGLQTATQTLVSELTLDDCIFDFEIEDEGLVVTRLSRPALNSTVEVWQEPGLAYQMLFTRRNRLPGDDFEPTLAIEPQTSPANAFRTREGLIWINPGDGLEVNWGVRVS